MRRDRRAWRAARNLQSISCSKSGNETKTRRRAQSGSHRDNRNRRRTRLPGHRKNCVGNHRKFGFNSFKLQTFKRSCMFFFYFVNRNEAKIGGKIEFCRVRESGVSVYSCSPCAAAASIRCRRFERPSQPRSARRILRG